MSIMIKTDEEIVLMRKAGKIVAGAHELVESMVKPGISTYDLDKAARDYILSMMPYHLSKTMEGSLRTSVLQLMKKLFTVFLLRNVF